MSRARAAFVSMFVSTLVASLSLASVLLLAAADASAYRMWLEADRDVSTMAVGDVVTLELHLDTEGQSNLVLLSVGTLYDPNVVWYDQSASSINEYALYGPGLGKGQTSSYLDPLFDAPVEWVGNLPPIGGQVNSDFIVNNLPMSASPDWSLIGTVATSEDEWLSTMVFEKVAEGDVGFLLTGTAGGNTIGYVDDAGSFVNGTILDTGSPIGVGSTEWLTGSNEGPGDTGDPTEPPSGGGDTGTGGGGGGTGTGDPTGDPVGAVPEPTAALLFGVGAVVFARRRIGRGR